MILAMNERQVRAFYDLQAMICLAECDLNEPGLSDAEKIEAMRRHLNELYQEVMELHGPTMEPNLN